MVNLSYDARITPESVLTYDEEPSRIPFTSGDAVFLRNCSYTYGLDRDAAGSSVVDKVAYASLPHFEEGKSIPCLGGYQSAGGAVRILQRWIVRGIVAGAPKDEGSLCHPATTSCHPDAGGTSAGRRYRTGPRHRERSLLAAALRRGTGAG